MHNIKMHNIKMRNIKSVLSWAVPHSTLDIQRGYCHA
ncbi:hypothetical protein Glaag_1943 [Glaciecola sp. 4H-3-7+YE-5]|jgi:hypothetical protein|nr:hypothetical protein Glaag_1943 [Glaciecola sp. 4H-3-7+YE-5]